MSKIIIPALFLVLLAHGLDGSITFVGPADGGVTVWWTDPPEDTVEYLILWHRKDVSRIDGFEFLDRSERSYFVEGLLDCTVYTFTLIGFDWSYQQTTYGSSQYRTGNCGPDYQETGWVE
ncbi:hypothetical protein PHET_05449 [Paragonimus heterotremus]|uniref:Fibronectin type-III domain-containing protein n=1 Tax=Paragonimus heterotremus TaxID=100268 RepID=A0A8J4SLD7_9TREM|nr:hypothetical protein PHET_05449 [Paragonimus heterotremus]